MNRRKVRKLSLNKRKRFNEMPTGDGGSGGSTFAAEVHESIGLKLHGYTRLITMCLAMIRT